MQMHLQCSEQGLVRARYLIVGKRFDFALSNSATRGEGGGGPMGACLFY